MRKLFILFWAIVALVTACDKKPDKPGYFYKKLTGTIGKDLTVTMNLTCKDSTLSGSCYYDDLKLYATLNGEILPSGVYELYGSGENFNGNGNYTGSFTSAATFEGTWTNPETGQSFPFNLTEIKQGIAVISYDNFSKKFCKRTERKRAVPEEERWWTDSMCSNLTVDIVKVTGPAETANGIINRDIVGLICGEKFTTFEDYISSLVDTEDTEFFESVHGCNIHTNDQNILCFDVVKDDFYGGAHGMQTLFYHNYDLLTGKTISLNDILRAGYEKKLNRVAGRIFYQ